MLEAIGLSPTEEELYERLVHGAELTAGEVGAVAGDLGASVAGDLARLQELGLVVLLPGDPPQWLATPPGNALDALIRDAGQSLAEAARQVAELDARFGRAVGRGGSPAPVQVLQGRDAIVRWANETQGSARSQIRACDAPPYPEHNPAAVNTMELDHLRRGIRYRILYDRRALDVPGRLADLEAGIAAGEEARVTDIPVKMTLFDDTVAVLPLRAPADVESRLVVHDPVLVGALCALFEMYWERALPLRVTDGRAHLAADESGRMGDGGAAGIDTADAHLLTLLVAGLTDREIAAQLHLSERTVRSKVRSVTTRLDAATRFQAGYQAVVRGWLATDDTPAAVHVDG